jgi:hypothetical protein
MPTKKKAAARKQVRTNSKERDTERVVRAFTVPKKIPEGRVLMHNPVRIFEQFQIVGDRGFRVWTDIKPSPDFVLCPCGYAGLKHYALKDFVAGIKQR